MNRPLVVFSVGMPGSGKTSLLRRLRKCLPDSVSVRSSDIREETEALDLLSIEQKRRITSVALKRVSAALASDASFVLVDMNLLLNFQRRAFIELLSGRSIDSVLLHFVCEREISLDSIRMKLANDTVYRQIDNSPEEYMSAVESIFNPISDSEGFGAVIQVDLRARAIAGDLFGLNEEFGNCVADLVSNRLTEPEFVAGQFSEMAGDERVLLTAPKFDVRETKVRTSEGQTERRVYVRKKDYVGIIGVNADDELLLIREFRSASAARAWVIAGGAREDGESAVAAARREFSEETRYSAQTMSLLYSEPSVSSSIVEMNWVFVARGLRETALESLENSRLDVCWMTKEEVMRLLVSGGFQEKVTVALVRFLGPWISQKLLEQ